MPARESVAFLTQRSYVPERLTVREVLTYPQPAGAANAPADDKLLGALKWAGLDEALPSLDAAVGKLSGGQEQRLQIARLVLSPPTLAVLDEASSNLEASFESKFFQWCASSKLSLLTVSHTADVAKHHTHELVLDGTGKATLKSL